jgi:hypothetical protein
MTPPGPTPQSAQTTQAQALCSLLINLNFIDIIVVICLVNKGKSRTETNLASSARKTHNNRKNYSERTLQKNMKI